MILVGGLVALVLLALAIAAPSNDQQNPSSRSAGKLGTLALYTWFGRLGLPVDRISGSFDLSSTDILICYDPQVALSDNDMASIATHLRSGGDLVLVIGPESVGVAAPLLTRLGVQLAGTLPAGVATPAQPFDSSDRLHSVPVGAGFSFADAPGFVPLLVEGDQVVAGMVRIGTGGRAYVLGDTQPLSNDGLRHDDSEFLALSLLQRARGGRIGFDEFHHGEGGGPGGAGAIFSGPVGLAAVLGALIVLLAIALNGRHLGAAVQPEGMTRVPSATTYVTAMGQLFARSRERGPIAMYYADELKRRIAVVTGIDAHLDDASFTGALAAAGDASSAAAVELLSRARAMAAVRPDEAALLRLAREVDRFERDWAAVPVG